MVDNTNIRVDECQVGGGVITGYIMFSDPDMEELDQHSNITNLVTGLTDEIVRVTEVRDMYLQVAGSAGLVMTGLMLASINSAKHAQGTGDIVAMMSALKDLKTYTL